MEDRAGWFSTEGLANLLSTHSGTLGWAGQPTETQWQSWPQGEPLTPWP